MVRNPALFKPTFKLKRSFLVHQKRTLHYNPLSMQKPDEVTRGQQKPEVKHHTALSYSGFQTIWAGHLSASLHLPCYASLCPFSEILFFVQCCWAFCPQFPCHTSEGSVSSDMKLHVSTCSLGWFFSLFPFLFSSPAGSFSVNSNNNTSVLSVPAILFYECQNPGPDECPWGFSLSLNECFPLDVQFFRLTELVGRPCWI